MHDVAELLQVKHLKLQLKATHFAATVVCYTYPSLHWQAVWEFKNLVVDSQVKHEVVVEAVQVRQVTEQA